MESIVDSEKTKTCIGVSTMMEKEDSVQKLYTRMRLWEFPDQYVIEPTDGSSGSSLSVSRVDGSMKLIG